MATKTPKSVATARKKCKFNQDFESPEQMWDLVVEFFDKNEPKQWNLARLLNYLYISKTKYYLLRDKDEKYKLITEFVTQHFEEKYLDNLEKPACTGAIFALKNMGYSDKQDINATMKGNLSVEQLLKGTKIKA